MEWLYVCRSCRSEYDIGGNGLTNKRSLQSGANPISGHKLNLCGACGNVVDLCPVKSNTEGVCCHTEAEILPSGNNFCKTCKSVIM